MFLALAFGLMVPAARLAIEGRVSPLWLLGLYFLQTVGEMCISPVGLSTFTKVSPRHLVGAMLGVWFLGAAFGNKFAGVLAARGIAGSRSPADVLAGAGFLGAFTTYSAVSVETVLLVDAGRPAVATAYLVASVVGGVAASAAHAAPAPGDPVRIRSPRDRDGRDHVPLGVVPAHRAIEDDDALGPPQIHRLPFPPASRSGEVVSPDR